MPLPPERREIVHLLRRAGLGASPAEVDAYVQLGYAGAVARLVDYEQAPNDALEARVAQLEAELDLTRLASIQTIWLTRMRFTARPLQEKMVLFWHDHFATANAKVGRPQLMHQQNQFFRDHALGDYRTILRGVSRDPAMLRYLDGNANRRRSPNENYARELLELFTLGIGRYTETDVREAARAFTGWSLNRDLQFTFNARQHDDGPKTFLGQTGRWNGDDIIDIILRQPAAAEHLAAKLFAYFVHDHPSPATVRQLAAIFRDSGYKVRELVRAILLHPEFRSPEAYQAQVKSPVEFLIGSMKLLGVEEFLPGAEGMLSRMGMNLFNPPSVAGWDWGLAWIGTNTYLERLNAANALTTQRGNNAPRGLDPAALVAQLGAQTPDALVDGLLDLLVDGEVSPEVRAALVDYATNGYQGAPDRFFQSEQRLDRAVRGVTHLIMSTPLYQLA